MENRKHSDNSFLAGLVLGGVIGAGLAFVFGQEDKDELKKSLVKKSKTALKNLGEILEENTPVDLKKHWGKDEEDKEKEEPSKKETKPTSTAKKLARKFFHRNGKKLR